VNVADAMLLENGTVNPELFLKDKLHMNAKGYAVWTEVLKSKIFE
jgi:lysophospholipase L1-like esterase